jgi:hypothetical protein
MEPQDSDEYYAWAEQETVRRRREYLARKAKPRFAMPTPAAPKDVRDVPRFDPQPVASGVATPLARSEPVGVVQPPQPEPVKEVIVLDEAAEEESGVSISIGHATIDLPAMIDGIPVPFVINLDDPDEGRRYSVVENSVRVITLHDAYIDVAF